MTRRRWWGAALVLLGTPGTLAAQTFEVLGRAATFTVGGRLHVQAEHSSPDGADPSELFLRRARINVDVAIVDVMDARLQPDFVGGEVELQDAWVRFRFAPAFRLSLGQFHRAHEGFERTSSTEIPLIERDGRISGVEGCAGTGGVCSLSRLVAGLGYAGRDAGLRAEGRLGERVGYEVTVTNGTGINVGDENDAKSFSARATVGVTDDVQLGAFWGAHDHPALDDPEETDYGTSGGLDIVVGSFRDGGRLQAGVVQGDNWRLGPDATFRAAQVLGSWYMPVDAPALAGWEPLFRVGWADPDADVDDDHGLLLTPGVMVYVAGRNRLGTNLDFYEPATGASAWSFKLQAYLYF